ncbi:MAG: hypothetical protein AB8B65_09490 [Kordia sp.]|uniref:hypothetical protein n=1 Tax=Kordia sp. TaxID=1965332 RepID=UPI003859FA0A
MKLSSYILFIFSILLCVNYASGQSVGTKNNWSEKLIDPIAVDKTLESFMYNITISSGFDTIFNKQPRYVRQFSNQFGYGDPIAMKGDTVYVHTEAHFNAAGQMTKLKNEDNTYFYFYDKKGNIVHRESRDNDEDHYGDKDSRVERMSYDTYGNLLTYFEYKITKDSVYHFDEYKTYSYQKQGTDIIVTIKGLEERAGGRSYYQYITTKTFDNAKLIQLEHNKGKFLGNGASNERTDEYVYEIIKGKPYLQSVKYTSSNQIMTYNTLDTYIRDTLGRLVMKFDKTIKPSGYYGYRYIYEYPEKNTKVTKLLFETNIPKARRGSYEDVKEGLQKTFIKSVDNYGNVTKDAEIDSDKNVAARTQLAEYTFDKHLNWITKTITDKYEYTLKDEDDTGDVEKYYREISYFSSPEKLAKPPEIDKKATALKNEILLAYFK